MIAATGAFRVCVVAGVESNRTVPTGQFQPDANGGKGNDGVLIRDQFPQRSEGVGRLVGEPSGEVHNCPDASNLLASGLFSLHIPNDPKLPLATFCQHSRQAY
jgi:hypothetical protein